MPQRSTPVRPEKPQDSHADLIKAAKALVSAWSSSGFYDRQDATLALALDEALKK
jgi:hypothetical protein